MRSYQKKFTLDTYIHPIQTVEEEMASGVQIVLNNMKTSNVQKAK